MTMEQAKQVAGATIGSCLPPKFTRTVRLHYGPALKRVGAEWWLPVVVTAPLGIRLTAEVRVGGGSAEVRLLPYDG